MKNQTTVGSSSPEGDLRTEITTQAEKQKANYINIQEIDQILNSLFDYNLEHARFLLKELELPIDGPQKALRTKLRIALINGHLSPSRVISLIRAIERWGYQHIYFFKAPEILGEEWNSEAKVMAQLKDKGLLNLFTQNPKWRIPKNTAIENITFNYPNLTVSVVIPRTWNERVKTLDTAEGDLFMLAYRKRASRSVCTFEWNVVTGHAFLAIPQTSYADYTNEKDSLLGTVSEAIPVKGFELCSLSKAIKETMNQEGVLVRGLGLETITGETISAKSRSKKHDVFENEEIAAAISLLDKAHQNDGNFYLPAKAGENKTFRCRMHPDHRLSIYNQVNETEVRHVITTIQRTF